MKNIVLLFLVLSVALFSCKKKEIMPLPASNSPVFYMNGEFDGQSISHTAGDNGMVMTPGIEDRNGVNYAFAQFSDGSTKFKIGLFDGNVAIPNNDKNFQAGDTMFFAQESAQSLAYLSPSLMSNGYKVKNVNWYANDVLLDSGSDNVAMTEPGVYFVRGDFTFQDNTFKQVVNRMYLGFENDVDFNVHHLVTDPNELKLWIEGPTVNIDSIQWYLDGQYVWTGNTCTKDIGNSIKDVTAKAFYNNGAVQEKKILVDGSHVGRYIEDFGIFYAPDQYLRWDYKVGIEVERNGQTYTSFDVANYKGSFVVKSVSTFIDPVSGEKAVRLDVDIDAKLKSTSTGEIIETKMSAVIGFPASY